MKELQERAEMYAAEKMNELMTKAIAQAYEDGYRNGYKDRESDIVELDDTELDVEVCDLGLPSGTLWTQGYFKDEEGEQYFAYAKAAKLGLPTKEQVEELIENCKWQGDYSYSGMTFYYGICVGATGESIRFNSNGYMEGEKCVHGSCGDSDAYFWIQDDEDGTEKNAVRIGGVSAGKPDIEIVKIFSGYKLPVLVVRK